jgi:hypothetical protein
MGFLDVLAVLRKLRQPPEPLPACGVPGCTETCAHSHAPDTGWIRPDSWDYENNCPRK